MATGTKQIRHEPEYMAKEFELNENQYIEGIDIWFDNLAHQWVIEATVNEREPNHV